MTHFASAIARPPGASYAQGLTSGTLGAPDLALAQAQHRAYVDALRACGVNVIELPPDDTLPDSTFVEDTAIVTARGAVITRPGAPSRRGEIKAIAEALQVFASERAMIQAPGCVDGGDICDADGHFLIGISERTNAQGARQLAAALSRWGYTSAEIDIRGLPGLLHLKSGIAYLSNNRMVLIDALREHPALARYEAIVTAPEEEYAANCVRVNARVLVASGYPRLEAELREHGYDPLPLDMSEFRKMDGGLSCLSLRW
jgi:dimethylargininase